MQGIRDVIHPDSIIFVMDGAIGQAAYAQAKAFKDAVDVGSVVITKLDGHANGGGALSAVAATKSPIIFIGTGEKMNQIQEFHAESFVLRLLGYRDPKGFIRMATEFANQDEYKKWLQHIQNGKMTIRDWKEQLTNLQKMGQLSSIMQMMGLKGDFFKEENIDRKFKSYMVILDSMANRELDGSVQDVLKQPTRLERIARGSGRSVREVNELFEQIKMFQQCIDKLPPHIRKQLTNPNNQIPDEQALAKLQQMMGSGGQMNQKQLQQLLKQMGAVKYAQKVVKKKR